MRSRTKSLVWYLFEQFDFDTRVSPRITLAVSGDSLKDLSRRRFGETALREGVRFDLEAGTALTTPGPLETHADGSLGQIVGVARHIAIGVSEARDLFTNLAYTL